MLLLKDCMFKNKENQEEDGDEGVKASYVVVSISSQMLQDLIEMTIKKMDFDRDGRVSYSDYVTTVHKEPLMMEAFGTCLPTSTAGNDFVRKILDSRPYSKLLQE